MSVSRAELAHAGLRHPEGIGELVVALSPLEDQVDDRPLLRRQLVVGGHAGGNDSLLAVSEDAPVPPAGAPQNLNDALGMEVGEFDEQRIAGSFEVTDRVRQPFGIVHGGRLRALAETLASVATYFAVEADGEIAVGQSNDTSFLRPVSEGTVSRRGDAPPPRPHELDLGRRVQATTRAASAPSRASRSRSAQRREPAAVLAGPRAS